ncbi:MAG: hypothetical protein U0798_05640 [Gemmataceae bacterium]
MIPKLGKLFVFFNVAVALALVTWSVSLTSNRLDWIDKPEGFNAADENPYAADTNNLERLANKVSKINDAIKAAQHSLTVKANYILAVEAERDNRAAAIEQRIQVARKGKFKTLVYMKNSGLLDFNQPGIDVQGIDAKPLAGLDAIQQEIRNSVDNQTALVSASFDLRKKYETLTDEITKLDEEISRQKVILTNAEIESKYLADRFTDWDEQVRTLNRRMTQIKQRIAELKP